MNSRPVLKVAIYQADNSVNFASEVANLIAARELLFSWIGREIRIRYKQSFLGAAWAVIQPLSMMIVFSVVFTRFIKIDTGSIPYPVFSYTALLPWTLFSNVMTNGTLSVVNNISLITKVKFPREILPLAQIGVACFDFFIASVIFVGLLMMYRINIHWVAIQIVPLILIQIILMAGIILFTSSLTIRFRDIRFVIPLATQLLMFATPIIYPATLIPEDWLWVYRLNPLCVLIEGYRNSIVYGRLIRNPDIAYLLVFAVILFICGYIFFKRTEIWFADIQ